MATYNVTTEFEMPDWRASAEVAEQVFINAGVECLFMFEGA